MKPREVFAAAGLCLLGWALFVTDLGQASMWYDEWFTWRYATMDVFDIVRDTALDVHPPFYYFIFRAWVAFTGSQDLAIMRLSSALLAVLGVALVWRIGRRWFGSSWAGAGAAAFLATCGVYIHFARELRMYALLVLLLLISWALLARYQRTGRRRALLAYAATVALMLYTYYFSGFAVLVQLAGALHIDRHRWRGLLAAYVIAGLAFLPWVPTLVEQMRGESLFGGRDGTLSLGSIGKFAATSPTSIDTVTEFINTYTAGQPAFVLGVLAMAVVLGTGAAYRGDYRRRVIAALIWSAGLALLFFAVNPFVPVYNLRYPLPVVGGMALLAGAAVHPLQRRARYGLVALIAAVGVLTHPAGFMAPRPPHRELLTTIAANLQPDDRVSYHYSYAKLGTSLTQELSYYRAQVTPALTLDRFVQDDPAGMTAPRIWDARPYWIGMPPEVEAALAANHAVTEQYTFEGYTLSLWEAPPASEPLIFGDLLAVRLDEPEGAAAAPGDTLELKSWWRALEPTGVDYSYGLFLRDAQGAVVSEAHAGLESDDGRLTSAFTDDWLDNVARPSLTLPADLPAGQYTLWLGIYYWEDPERLPVAAPPDTPADADLRMVQVCAVGVG